MAEFQYAHSKVEAFEGGYVNDPQDKGLETYAGVSRKYFPNWSGWRTVDAHKPLKRGEIIEDVVLRSAVKGFYKVNFWNPIKGDYIESQEVATFVYDWHVNSGKHAITHLQKCLGITADGVFGNGTLAAVNAANDTDLLQKLKQARIDFYCAIVAKDPPQGKFLNGWLARVERLA